MCAKRNQQDAGRLAAEDAQLAQAQLWRYVEQHCAWMTMRNYAAGSIQKRREWLRAWVLWSLARGLQELAMFTRPILERYQHHLAFYRKTNGDKLAVQSQHNRIVALQQFFRWAVRQNYLQYNPASDLDMPRLPRRLPRAVLSVAQVAAILAEANPDELGGLRDRAMFEVLYSTGMRRAELAKLEERDMHLGRGVALVREGKGKKDRFVPVGERAQTYLVRYLEEARPALNVGGALSLFLTDHGEPVSGEYVSARFKKAKARAGIATPGAAHMLRHACATHMLEGGADVRFIQVLLGHSNLSSTEIYTHVSIEKLKAIHSATHPARLTHASAAGEPGAGVQIDLAPEAVAALHAALEEEAQEEEQEGGMTPS